MPDRLPRSPGPAARAAALTLAAHALLGLAIGPWSPRDPGPAPAATQAPLVWLAWPSPPAAEPAATPTPPPARRDLRPPPRPRTLQADWVPQQPREPGARAPVVRAAPPPPSAEAWALAARYTLHNSKAYRHSWGQQVRHGMGDAVEGAGEGAVRFRVEIAPDGALARLETLWATSAEVERRAREAIAQRPRGPATPTGRPLVFERTIVFSAFAHEEPPLYQDDCTPEPPAFRNPFAWDGRSPREPARAAAPAAPADPQALADCLRQRPPDSIDAELARDRRLMERWGWGSAPR